MWYLILLGFRVYQSWFVVCVAPGGDLALASGSQDIVGIIDRVYI